MTTPKSTLPVRAFRTQRAFSAWLAANHAQSRGLWLKIAKKASGIASIDYPRALEAALCWGWIDGQSRRIDDDFYVQKFTPRSARSIWSKVNCAKAEALIAAGRMAPPGLAEVERAKQDGRWARAYDSPRTATVPEDFAAALARNKRAAAFFERLDSRNRYAMLHRLQTAKKPETRQRRIEQFSKMLVRREKIYPSSSR